MLMEKSIALSKNPLLAMSRAGVMLSVVVTIPNSSSMAARSVRNLALMVVKSAILEMFLAQVGVGKINSRFHKLSPRIDDGSGCDAVSDLTGILDTFLR